MAETSTARLGLDAAPGGLRLVQDLVNAGQVAAFPDLLGDLAGARAWLGLALTGWAEATGQPAPRPTLRERDLPALRRLRGELTAALTGDVGEPVPASIELLLTGRKVNYSPPQADVCAMVAALALAELLIASRTGSLARLKSCANPLCAAAFYDTSKNTARVWHDVRTCGNAANLRASRARRKNPQP